jgi:hypothetical protein
VGWFKVWDEEILDGSIASESRDTQLAWIKILALSNLLQYGARGTVSLGSELGFPDAILARKLHISARRWRDCKADLVKSGRILIGPTNVITIPKWHFYQSEYQRQSPYRTKGRLPTGLRDKVTSQVTSVEEEVRRRRRKKKEEEEEELLTPSAASAKWNPETADPDQEYDLPY